MNLPELKEKFADYADALSCQMNQMKPFRLWAVISAVCSLPFVLVTDHLSAGVSQFFFMLLLWSVIVFGWRLWMRIRRRYLS